MLERLIRILKSDELAASSPALFLFFLAIFVLVAGLAVAARH